MFWLHQRNRHQLNGSFSNLHVFFSKSTNISPSMTNNVVILYLAMLMLKRDRCNERQFFFRLGHLSFLIVHDVHYRLYASCYLYSVACNNMSVNGRSVSVAVKHQLLMRTLWDNCAINQSFSLSHAEITSDKRGLPEGRGGYLKDSPTGSLPFKHVYSSRCGLISSASEPYWTLKIWLNYLWNFVIFAKWNIAKEKLKKGKCYPCSTVWRSQ